MIPIMICLFFLIVLAGLIPEYVRGTKENYYQYQNVKNLGLIIYITALLTMQIPLLMAYGGIQAAIILLMRSVEVISYVLLPFFFIVSILVTISNIVLMKKEGRSIYNMLGCFLGIAICAGILFPRILSELLQRSSVIDVHNEQGIYLYIEIFVENAISVIVFYLDCILAATIILAFRAAKNVPSFNQSYILILGCQIKPDGSVTNLLKGRADRAIEFAAMQKEKTGKPIVFVPSGGQGEDEVTSEAQAIKNYLLSQGIAEKDILVEDQSTDTKENFAFSMDKIEKAGGSREDAIAFSTTNYHVFRSGILASMQGIKAEGIGSKTKSYFWVNAFIREFIATLYTERKTHIRVILGLTLIVMVMAVILFANAVL
ncbi:MAG: YdcF family protein [Firmicutes bacterium]|nr:YdcF family protein [Bacillota bacterium]